MRISEPSGANCCACSSAWGSMYCCMCRFHCCWRIWIGTSTGGCFRVPRITGCITGCCCSSRWRRGWGCTCCCGCGRRTGSTGRWPTCWSGCRRCTARCIGCPSPALQDPVYALGITPMLTDAGWYISLGGVTLGCLLGRPLFARLRAPAGWGRGKARGGARAAVPGRRPAAVRGRNGLRGPGARRSRRRASSRLATMPGKWRGSC